MTRQPTFLEEIDARQNDVLERLDDLNQKVEQIIQNWMSGRAKAGHAEENTTSAKSSES